MAALEFGDRALQHRLADDQLADEIHHRVDARGVHAQCILRSVGSAGGSAVGIAFVGGSRFMFDCADACGNGRGFRFEKNIEEVAGFRLLFFDLLNGNARDDGGHVAALANPIGGVRRGKRGLDHAGLFDFGGLFRTQRENFSGAFESFAREFERSGGQERFGIELNADLIDAFAAAECFGDHQPLVLGPFELRFASGLLGLREWFRQKALNVFAQSAAGGRLQIVAIGREHFVECVRGGENHFGDQAGVLLREFRSQDVFQIVRELAQLAEAARGRVALQRVHGAANAAKLLFVAGALFEREAGFVHGLENLLGALEEEIAEFGGVLVGEKGH